MWLHQIVHQCALSAFFLAPMDYHGARRTIYTLIFAKQKLDAFELLLAELYLISRWYSIIIICVYIVCVFAPVSAVQTSPRVRGRISSSLVLSVGDEGASVAYRKHHLSQREKKKKKEPPCWSTKILQQAVKVITSDNRPCALSGCSRATCWSRPWRPGGFAARDRNPWSSHSRTACCPRLSSLLGQAVCRVKSAWNEDEKNHPARDVLSSKNT